MELYVWFLICVAGLVAIVPLYFLSVEHLKLRRKYGEQKGNRIGEILGLVSGWGFFLFWIGIWVSPQPRFVIPILQDLKVAVSGFSVPVLHVLVSVPFIGLGAWLGIAGAREVTLRVSETHRTERIVTTGVYSVARHPQYLGGLLSHIGISFLLSAFLSLISTPLVILIVYVLSRKEERELMKEFGDEYVDYKGKVQMLIPRL